MFIQIEVTPNPQTLKFVPECEITGGEPVNVPSRDLSYKSPLAKELFRIEEVAGVFLGADFITITKDEHAEWDIIKPIILATLMDFFTLGKKVLAETSERTEHQISNEDDSEIVKQIKEIIEEKVRPAVANDGGDIIFVGYEDGIVKLELHGSCAGCPSSTITLKSGIENMLKYYVPEVIAVESV